MRFGETLAREHVPEFRLHYLDYEGLKTLIAELAAEKAKAAASADEAPAVRFLRQLDSEFTKVNAFTLDEVARLARGIDECLRQMLNVRATSASEAGRDFPQEARELGHGLVRVERYVRQNKIAFRKITKKFDKNLGERAGVWLQARLKAEPFCKVGFDPLLVQLSECHMIARELAGGDRGEHVPTRPPPAEFRRDVSKYWVRPEDEVRLMTILLPHVPILRPRGHSNVDAGPKRGSGGGDDEGTSELRTLVSSVYLDAEALPLYHARLRLDEGASLVRLRFYDHTEPALCPSVFVETKVHHEKWTGQSSLKARMPLEPPVVRAYLLGSELDCGAQCAAAVARGDLPRADAAASSRLGNEVQQSLRAGGLVPTVRSVYRRCAFEHSQLATGGSAGLRVTLDSDLRVRVENGIPESGWCAPPARSSSCELAFPHSILEIKYRDEPPPFLDELLSSGIIEHVPKFSKYLTAAAALHPSRCKEVPSWFGVSSLAGFVANASDAALPSSAALPSTGAGGSQAVAVGTIVSTTDREGAERRPSKAGQRGGGARTVTRRWRGRGARMSTALRGAYADAAMVDRVSLVRTDPKVPPDVRPPPPPRRRLTSQPPS